MAFVTHLRLVYGVAYLSSRWIKRQPQWLIQSVLSYIGFAILLYAWGGLEGLTNIIVAMLVGGFWNLGVNIIAQMVGWYRVSKVQHMFVASPVRPHHYILGMFVASLVYPAASIASITPIVWMLDAWTVLLYSLLMGLVSLLAGIMTGLVIVLYVRNPVNVSAVTNPISWLLTILPPVYYPASILPPTLRFIALTVPTSATAEVVRQLAGMGASTPLWYPVLVVASWILLGLLLISKVLRWGHE